MVSASRLAAAPQLGQATLTQSSAAPSGDEPFGFKSNPVASGNSTGSWLSGTGTSPQLGQ